MYHFNGVIFAELCRVVLRIKFLKPDFLALGLPSEAVTLWAPWVCVKGLYSQEALEKKAIFSQESELFPDKEQTFQAFLLLEKWH